MVFSFRPTLLMDILLFIDNSDVYYFSTTDMALITMRLDDAIMESDEDGESANQFPSDQVLRIRRGIVKLVSNSLTRKITTV